MNHRIAIVLKSEKLCRYIQLLLLLLLIDYLR